MTISPPSNVRLSPGEPGRVLACGVDSLVLAVDVEWLTPGMLWTLTELRAEAEAQGEEVTGKVITADDSAEWLFTIKPHGATGYAFLLDGGGMAWQVVNAATPGTRPSVMVAFRSELLWTHGPTACVERALTIITGCDGEVRRLKVSRADLCVDVLLPAAAWECELREHVVSRAEHRAPYFSKTRRTGLQIGKGKVMARLYDKPLEIVTKGGKKIWMYDVWGVQSVADDHRIIRVEFEAKREGLKALGIDTFDDLERLAPNLWRYCTHKWLRMVDDPDKHGTRQKLLPWWPVVQAGYSGAQDAQPLIRAQAIRADEKQMSKQLLGNLTSLAALLRQGELIEPGEVLDLPSHLAMLADTLQRHGWDDAEFTERVKRKQAKHRRYGEKFAAAERARAAAGVSLDRK